MYLKFLILIQLIQLTSQNINMDNNSTNLINKTNHKIDDQTIQPSTSGVFKL